MKKTSDMLHIILDSVEKTINKLGGRSKENAQCVARRNESENKNIKEKLRLEVLGGENRENGRVAVFEDITGFSMFVGQT